MKIIKSSLAGLRSALGNPGVICLLWLTNLIIALPVIWVMCSQVLVALQKQLLLGSVRDWVVVAVVESTVAPMLMNYYPESEAPVQRILVEKVQ